MRLFKKEPPKACPKCGEASGWRFVVEDVPVNSEMSASAVNPFSTHSMRGSVGQSAAGAIGKTRLLYRCENCGYEKKY
ncbi:MAG: hypothetical protein J5589_10130 [Firmicutes bacterium]|nr:hypothetical protein [Bacillota bacterium]